MQSPFTPINTHTARMEGYQRAARVCCVTLRWGTLALLLAFLATGKPLAAVKEAVHVYSLEGME